MPSIKGLRKNTSLVQVDVGGVLGIPSFVFPLTADDMNQFVGGWMQELKTLLRVTRRGAFSFSRRNTSLVLSRV